MSVKDLLKDDVKVITYDTLKPDLRITLTNKYGYKEIWYYIDFDLNSLIITLDGKRVTYRSII